MYVGFSESSPTTEVGMYHDDKFLQRAMLPIANLHKILLMEAHHGAILKFGCIYMIVIIQAHITDTTQPSSRFFFDPRLLNMYV